MITPRNPRAEKRRTRRTALVPARRTVSPLPQRTARRPSPRILHRGTPRILGSLFSALAFLTVLPIPESLKSRKEGAMFAAYPAAGLLIGALLSLVYLAAMLVFPPSVAAVVLIGASLLLTGALHVDGLADCADAFYGKRTKSATLRILKDPRIGTMGGTAISLSLLARFASLGSLPSLFILAGLPVIMMFSRTTVVLAMKGLPYVTTGSGILPARLSLPRGLILLAVIVSGASVILLPVPLLAASLALAVFWRISWNRIGGCTGDVLGASIEIAEIAALLALTAVSQGGSKWDNLFPILRLMP
jgi:adenosylcobinamide-GDP ribazoletransferase